MDDEIDLRQYLNILWRRRGTITVVTLVAALAAVLFGFLAPPLYEAEALLFVARPPLEGLTLADPSNPNLRFIIGPQSPPALLVQTIVELARSRLLQRKLAGEVLVNPTDAKLDEELTARGLPEANLVKLRVRGNDPNRVARTANLWGELVISESEPLMSTRSSKDRPPMKLIEAVAPDSPVAPRKTLNIAVAAILGLVAGAIASFIMDYFNPSVPAVVSGPLTPAVPDPPSATTARRR